MSEEFFNKRTEASEVKTKIVSKYFTAWSNVMKPTRAERLAYIDLFSGPGRYEDGAESTPLIILRKIIADPILASRFVTHFNDADPAFVENLKNEIEVLPNINNLRHKPHISNFPIDDRIADLFEKTSLVPSLAFVDPWGYKGLSLRLVRSLTKDWGCDCIFFFNYNRVNAAINNPIVKEHIDALFGEEKANYLRNSINDLSKEGRENVIINELASIVSSNGNHYFLPFRFGKSDNRTSHYLLFVSKHIKGYTLMKEIMYGLSSERDDGVANFSYIPSHDEQLSFLFSYSRPLDSLGVTLCEYFKGKTLSMNDIYLQHNIGTPFVKANYKEALKRLEDLGLIQAYPTKEKRPRNTFGDGVIVTFK